MHRAFFRAPADPALADRGEASPWMVVPICVVAFLALATGLYPDFCFHYFTLAGEVSAAVLEPATQLAGAAR